MTNKKISIVLPCQNEEESIGFCIDEIKKVFITNKIEGEIIVSDSSTDKSTQIAKDKGVRVIKHNQDGYGRAYLEGFKLVENEYIIMADPDSTYDFNEIPDFIKHLDDNYDMVIGNRFSKKMEKGSMPPTHKYIGNPFLSFIFRLLFNNNIKDVHCGMRAIKKEKLDELNLKSPGMEFASEMMIGAVKNNFKIKEISIHYRRRRGKSKLKTIKDGIRHLKLMTKYYLQNEKREKNKIKS
jgi:glycosyltransferase involved in cell wall biosynthesis